MATTWIYRTQLAAMEPPPQPDLPVDVLLEISARSDVATIMGFAVASKTLRRGILEPSFRRRLANIAAAKEAGRVPALATASYWIPRDNKPSWDWEPWAIRTSRPGIPRFDRDLPLGYQPVCSRDGLLVLSACRGTIFCVCNTFTGHVVASPPSIGWGTRTAYCPALIAVNDGHFDGFELLVLHRYWRFQTYSSRSDTWGPVRSVKSPLGRHRTRTVPMTEVEESLTAPVVIGRTVHWLCNAGDRRRPDEKNIIVLALHVDKAQAAAIKLPTIVASTTNTIKSLILSSWPAADGRLGLLVPRAMAISMWTLSPEVGPARVRTWSLHFNIYRHLTAGLVPHTAVRLEWFGERTGTVLLVMDSVGLVQMDLRTKKAMVLHRTSRVSCACLHEIDVVSFLNEMKHF